MIIGRSALAAAFLASTIPFASGYRSAIAEEPVAKANNFVDEGLAHDEGIENVIFFLGDKEGLDTYIPNSSRQIGKVKLVLDPDQAAMKDTLLKNGIQPEEIENTIKKLEEKAEEFNSLIEESKVLIIDINEGVANRTSESVLKPEVSPSETINKYEFAKFGFPIVINVQDLDPKDQRPDIDSIALKKYWDPKDDRVKLGIHIPFEENNTGLLVPNYVPVALKTKYGVLVIIKTGIFRFIPID